MKEDKLAKLEELIKERARLDEELEKFQRLLTVMFVDIVGSTSYFDRFGDVSGLVMVHKCIDMLTPIVERHKGTVAKTIGDAIMAHYEDPLAGVCAAVDMQRSLAAYNEHRTSADQMRVRIGLNLGLGLLKEKDVFGDVVNVAARIESLAEGEQILISASLAEKARTANIPCRKIAEAPVKGKAEKLEVYEVLWREVELAAPIEPVAEPARVAARVPVAEVAERPVEEGTSVLGISPVAAVAERRLRFSLIVIRPDGSPGQECELTHPTVFLGRTEGDILLPDDPLVSRHHARFTVLGEQLYVEDLGSSNGTFVRLRKPHTLKHDDIILAGRQMFRFRECQSKEPGAENQPAAQPPSSARAEAPAELVRLLPGGVEENHYPLQAGENILGRTRGTLTFPEDAYLSSQHAKVKYEGGKFILEDLQATNGTFVRIRPCALLDDGDIILIGHQLLRVTANPA